MGTQIHSTAIIDPAAELGQDVVIGPYVVIEGQTKIGDRTRIDASAQVKRFCSMGSDNHVHSLACVGDTPQDLKFAGEDSLLKIGDRNMIREFSTIHRGTEGGGGKTSIGSDCLFMAYSHVAHDCILGDRVILANAATLAGHVTIGSNTVVGGLSAVHQFVSIGDFAFIGGKTGVAQDIPPFMLCAGERAKLRGLNLIGLRRAGFESEEIKALKRAYRYIFKSDLERKEGLEKSEQEFPDYPRVQQFIDFIRNSSRGIASPEEK